MGLCCCSFLSDFEAVSIKMAKEQNISLNPSKISGNCGRLMCCLKYESDVYEEKLKRLPNVGAIVKTEDGEGEVDNIETLKEVVRVKIKDGDGYLYKKYNAKDLKIIKNNSLSKIDEEELNRARILDAPGIPPRYQEKCLRISSTALRASFSFASKWR